MAKRVELILLHPASALWQVLNVVALNRVCLQVRHLMDHSVTVGLFGPYELLQVALCRRAKAVARRLRDTGNFAQAWLYKHRLECPDSLQAARISF